MVAKEILSVQHPLVKRTVALRQDRKVREQEGRVLIVGKNLISDLASHVSFERLFYLEELPPFAAREKLHVSLSVLKKITGLEEPDGWAAIVPLPSPRSLKHCSRILILDQIGDPGNLGTLWRSALGLGWDGVWITPGTVDPFNDKALRAAKGATFRFPYEWIKREEISKWKGSLLVADLQGEPLRTVKVKSPLGLILSHESRGPHHWTKEYTKVTIPMSSSMESLNVASAGSILLYQLML
jgi:TrmH family RNA methyltransferase